MDAYCVWVVVRDSDQAAAFAFARVSVDHTNPEAILEVVKPKATSDDHYPLFSTLQLSGGKSFDSETPGAKLTYEFTATRNGAAFKPERCPEAPDTDICVPVQDPGVLKFELTVTDVRGRKKPASKTVTIEPDAPPCIRRTMPPFGLFNIVRSPDDMTLHVDVVEDDGDPYPAAGPQNLKFDWTYWREGSTTPAGALANSFPDGDFNNTFHVGDEVNIRLRVRDRVADRNFDACGSDASKCALDPKKPDCFQWVTWKFQIGLVRDM
jgi:hypothetical protein